MESAMGRWSREELEAAFKCQQQVVTAVGRELYNTYLDELVYAE